MPIRNLQKTDQKDFRRLSRQGNVSGIRVSLMGHPPSADRRIGRLVSLY